MKLRLASRLERVVTPVFCYASFISKRFASLQLSPLCFVTWLQLCNQLVSPVLQCLFMILRAAFVLNCPTMSLLFVIRTSVVIDRKHRLCIICAVTRWTLCHMTPTDIGHCCGERLVNWCWMAAWCVAMTCLREMHFCSWFIHCHSRLVRLGMIHTCTQREREVQIHLVPQLYLQLSFRVCAQKSTWYHSNCYVTTVWTAFMDGVPLSRTPWLNISSLWNPGYACIMMTVIVDECESHKLFCCH